MQSEDGGMNLESTRFSGVVAKYTTETFRPGVHGAPIFLSCDPRVHRLWFPATLECTEMSVLGPTGAPTLVSRHPRVHRNVCPGTHRCTDFGLPPTLSAPTLLSCDPPVHRFWFPVPLQRPPDIYLSVYIICIEICEDVRLSSSCLLGW